MTRGARWICAQLGSREHYAIPRVLHKAAKLDTLLTDFWAKPRWLWERVPGRRFASTRERWHTQLECARVHSLGLNRLAFDLRNRESGWETVMRRNEWFQRGQLRWLLEHESQIAAGPPGIFFAYSYAARELFRFFKRIGWTTVLGQIDPGPREEAIVAEEAERYPSWRGSWKPPPKRYWESWREELELADLVAVNSEWSLECLCREGLPEGRMRVLPLAFEPSGHKAKQRTVPPTFTRERPLRVLFLGQINLRKGAHHLLEAAAGLTDRPVEFDFVGPVEIARPDPMPANVHWHGPVSREETALFYARADLFALPTLSDGFALTQLEALAHGLPVIATRSCGRVVTDRQNGWLLDSPQAAEIAAILCVLMESPGLVAECSSRARVPEMFSMESLRDGLLSIDPGST